VKLVQVGLALPIPISTRPLDQAAQALADLQSGKILGRVVLRP
jgi:alcohol dehydrogenase, propanol-preferring